MSRALLMLMLTASLAACDYQTAAPVDPVDVSDVKGSH